MATGQRLLVKITRESLPQVKDKYPFIYLERGRLEVDDSSVKWIDADNHVVPLPVATLNALLLGPGTTITHEAVKAATAANCPVCWVGEDSLLFYAAGFLPTADTRNLKLQITLSADPVKSLEVARRMFARRFPDADLAGKTLPEMMGMEGNRVRRLYEEKALHYQVGWKGRSFPSFWSALITMPCLPHARGGVSWRDNPWFPRVLSSPRTWGCFPLQTRPAQWPCVFPTHVGVFLPGITWATTSSGLPHARGGVSPHQCQRRSKCWSSPRTWGCFFR